MNCTLCGKPIVLSPSAAERVIKYGETSKFYIDLFRQHSECLINKRVQDTLTLIRSQK